MAELTEDRTVLIHTDRARLRALARLRIRRAAYRIAAECELLMDELLRSEHRDWSDAFGRVLLAARKITVLAAPGGTTEVFDAELRPNDQIVEAQRAIVTAIHAVLPAMPQNTGEDAALRSVQVIRELDGGMLTHPEALPPEGAVDDAQAPQANRRARVLITDDDPGILQLLQRTLHRLGHDVTVASDGVEAL